MNFKIRYTNKEITPWSGMILIKRMIDKMGFRDVIKSCPSLPESGSNRGYSSVDILETFFLSIWCGANKFIHTEITRSDLALGKIFDRYRTPGNDAIKRFFRKFDMETNHNVSNHFFSWILGQVNFNYFTLDFDSTILSRSGLQEGAKKGYNPKRKGRPSHHPLMAFVADVNLVANFWLRSGDTSSSNNFKAFSEDTITKIKDKTVGLIRMDSGFFADDILKSIEEKVIDYIVAVKFYRPIQKEISIQQNWITVDKDIEIAETMYQAESWDSPRRIVIVRQKLEDKPTALGKTLSIFEGTELNRRHRYTAYVTNMKLSAVEIWRLYRGRADSENRIKELKADFGMESFNLNNFYPTEAALIMVMIAYNLMAIFRMFILKSEIQHTLSTLRFKTLAIGAYFEKVNNEIHLKIALGKKRRKWFEGLWNNSNDFKTPFVFF
ncbi:MAG: IS1380 family transposase [Sporocytophaga sp.]|nr:IS1380 family transposase [Sporocytophaga sp.]